MTFHGYIRVSSAGQVDNTSPEEQQRKIEAVAKYHGAEDVQIHEDLGVSGSIPLTQRPGGSLMWAELQKGDTVVVSKLDRAFRSAEDALVTSRLLREKGVELIIADLSVDPITKNGVGKIFFSLMASFAEFERERITERLACGKAAKKATGGFGGGRRPFGYDIVGKGREARLEPNPGEQEAIEMMAALSARKLSTRVIAARVKAGTGLDVSHVTVAKILRDMKENAQ